MNCPTCGAAYEIQTDGATTVRNACACDRSRTCSRKKCRRSDIVQVELTPDATEEVGCLCAAHAHIELLADGQVAAPPAPRRRKERVAPVNREFRPKPGREVDYGDVKVVCLAKGHAHTLNTRLWKDMGDGRQQSFCPHPKCDDPSYRLEE